MVSARRPLAQPGVPQLKADPRFVANGRRSVENCSSPDPSSRVLFEQPVFQSLSASSPLSSLPLPVP